MADRSVVARLGANVTGYVNNIRVAKAATVDFSKNAIAYGQKHQAQLDELSNKAAILGTGLLALSGFAVKAAMDWETAWAGVTKTVDGTPDQLAAIEQGLKDMSAVKPTSAIELAAIAESAGALGVKTDDILSFTSVMADLGQTTNLTSDEAATSIAQLMNVMQTAPEDVDNLGAALVDLGNKGASTERQIVQMAQNIAGAGSIVGLSEANVLALGNALASSGIEAEAGGSAISNVLMDIDMSVKSGNESIEGWAKVAGVSAKEFAAAWKADPAEALTMFIEGLGRMNDAGMDVFSTLDELGQSDIRVTRALLNMAASGDMLRTSLANGDAAWKQNTALAEEAAKRYDTTASQAKMAWNEVKSAAVDAGEELLPVVGQVAEDVGDLPDPVKTALTSIVGLGGVGLVAAAGLTKILTSVSGTRRALNDLGPTGTRAVGVLGKIGKAAGIAGVGFTALQVASSFRDSDVEGVGTFAKALLEVSGGSEKAKKKLDDLARAEMGPLEETIGGVAAAINEVDRNSSGLAEKANGFAGVFGFGDEKGANSLKAMDQALTSLVTSGATEEAARGFDYIADRAATVGVEGKRLKDLFPEYTDALAQNEVQSKLTGDATAGLGDKISMVPGMSKDAADALQEARDQAREAGEAFVGLGDDLDNPKVSLGDWISQLEQQGKALRDFTKNAKSAAKDGLDEGLIASLQEAGPAGALRMEQLANATDSEIKRANKAWRRGQQAIDDYTDAVGGVPPKAGTDLEVKGAPEALEAVRALQTALDNINPFKEITIHTRRTGADAGSSKGGTGPTKQALGGAIAGPGTATSDSIPALLSNGEHVLTAADVDRMGGQDAVYRFRQQLASGNVIAYATGGAVDPAAQARYDRFQQLEKSSKLDLVHQQQRIRDLEKSLKATETVGKGKNKHTRKVLRGLDRDVAEMELSEARAELKQMKADNRELKAYGSPGAEKKRYEDAVTAQQQAEDDAEAAENAAIEKARQVTSATESVQSRASIQDLTSPAAVDRMVSRMITDITGFTDVLARLKAKGAAPWLLDQMIKMGPSKSVIRLGEKYLADDAALASINSKAAILEGVSGSYGRMVTDERFMAPGAYAPEGVPQSIKVDIQALDITAVSAEIERRVVHSITTLAQAGGLGG
jgi:TP901 family phage tail tape measure protein